MKKHCSAAQGPGTFYTDKTGRFENQFCYCEPCNIAQARATLAEAKANGAAQIGNEERKYKRPAAKAYRPVKLEAKFVGLHSFQRMLEAYCGNNETAYAIHQAMIARDEAAKAVAA